jgi:hypothetical protein
MYSVRSRMSMLAGDETRLFQVSRVGSGTTEPLNSSSE